MKKLFVLALAATLAGTTAYAQKAFRNLGMSLEVGTTGAGVNLSYPVVTNHLILSVGYNFPTVTIKHTADLNPHYVNGKVNQVNEMIDRFNSGVATYNSNVEPLKNLGIDMNPMSPISEKVGQISTFSADIQAKLNFGNFKAMIEYYPTIKSAFHFTAGVMVGNGEWMTISGIVDRTAWNTYQQSLAASDQALSTVNSYNVGLDATNRQIDAVNAQIDEYNKLPGILQRKHVPYLTPITESAPVDDAAAVNLNGQTFVLGRDDDGRLDVALSIRKVKPYFGVGFGSSVPTKHRMGFQLELGMYYQGKPILESVQERPGFAGNAYTDKTIDELVKTIVHFQWYPQISFRWTGRLF